MIWGRNRAAREANQKRDQQHRLRFVRLRTD